MTAIKIRRDSIWKNVSRQCIKSKIQNTFAVGVRADLMCSNISEAEL